jgi:hypothetical protein
MKVQSIKIAFWGTILLFHTALACAHPTGNMVTIGENVLWSYINPVNDSNHYACVMIWSEGSDPKVFVQSEYAASDFMLYSTQHEVYMIERKYSQATDDFQIRVLKSTIGNKPQVIWDWFNDDYRIGEGGFFMLSDTHMVFGKYPDIYSLKKGETPATYFKFDQPINRLRAVDNNQILLLGDNSSYLVQRNGTILKQWNNLVDQSIDNAPLGRNQIFDADYSNGELLLSYWGNRSFDAIQASGRRDILLQQTEPLTPHWVAFWNNKKLLFSSSLIFDGSTPKPHLTLYNDQNNQRVIWRIPE